MIAAPIDPPRLPLVTGATCLVAMVGDPIRQAKSPENFNPLFAERGIDAVMVPFHVRDQDFERDMPALLQLGNLAGVVVTMPFKTRIMPMLASINENARRVGAVNAARRTPSGRWIGDIFDGAGLVGAVHGLGLDPAGLRVGLVGAGGAGGAIAFALAAGGVRSLDVMDRDGARAADLAARVRMLGTPVRALDALPLRELDLLVNASPVGMEADDGAPVDMGDLHAGLAVVDIVTRPTTALLRAARELNCRSVGGAAMVAAQTQAIIDFLGIPPGRT